MLPSEEAAARAAEARDRRPPMRSLALGSGSEPCTICQLATGRAKTGLCPRCEKLYGGEDWCGPARKHKPQPERPAAASAPLPQAEKQRKARERGAAQKGEPSRSGSRRVAADAPPEPDAPAEPLPDQVCSVLAAVLAPVTAKTGGHRQRKASAAVQILFGEEFWVEACARWNGRESSAAA
jgi:hypothetical protein